MPASNLANPNPYFPLGIGNRWEFRSQDQSTVVEVLNRTKLIDDVRCIVVRDVVHEEGKLHEATNDWYAQAKNGNVWYCGDMARTPRSTRWFRDDSRSTSAPAIAWSPRISRCSNRASSSESTMHRVSGSFSRSSRIQVRSCGS